MLSSALALVALTSTLVFVACGSDERARPSDVNAGAGAGESAGAMAGSGAARPGGTRAGSDGAGSDAKAAGSGGAGSGGKSAGSGGAGSGGKSAGSGGAGSGGKNAGSGGAGFGAGGAGSGGSSAAGSAVFHCPPGPFGAPIPSGATVRRIDGVPPSDAFNSNGTTRTNIEGAVWIAGKLYVSEFPLTAAPGSRILAIDPSNDTVATALMNTGTNGLAIDSMGNLIATDHKQGAIVRMSFPLGTPVVLVGSHDGKRFNSPNDLAVRSDGNIYFSDPDYQAPTSKPQPETRLYRLAPGASSAIVIDAHRPEPNGVTLSPDENTLYVSGTDGIEAYPILAGGVVTPDSGTRLSGFAGGADGLGIDCAGNLYATSGKRVVVLSPQGAEIGSIAVSQAENVTNVAFGGAEHKTLFITSMGTGNQRGVFRIDLDVPGLPY